MKPPIDDSAAMESNEASLGGSESSVAQDEQLTVEDTDAPTNPRPTLANHEQHKTASNLPNGGSASRGLYAEEQDPSLKGVPDESVFRSQMQKMASLSPEQRAKLGAQLGGGVGAAVSGGPGAIIGGAVGAITARSVGHVQNGQHIEDERKETVVEALNTLGVAKDNSINFKDGAEFVITQDPYARLQNVSGVVGKPDRTLYETDKSNPLTNRTTAVAMPISYYINSALYGYDPKDPQCEKSIKNTTNLLVNSFQNGIDNIDTAYSRAKEVASKVGATDKVMRAYFNSIKTKVPDGAALAIKQGLDILYGGK